MHNLDKITRLVNLALQVIPQAEQPGAVIFGSCGIALNGVDLRREVDDLDIFVSEAAYARLENLATRREAKAAGVWALRFGPQALEVLKEFPGVNHAEVLARAEPKALSQGFPVACLDDLLRWKRAQNRDKDRADTALIEAFKARQSN